MSRRDDAAFLGRYLDDARVSSSASGEWPDHYRVPPIPSSAITSPEAVRLEALLNERARHRTVHVRMDDEPELIDVNGVRMVRVPLRELVHDPTMPGLHYRRRRRGHVDLTTDEWITIGRSLEHEHYVTVLDAAIVWD